MTVVVAFVGSDGAVMASDSEATESGHTRFDVEKIWRVGGLIMGYTGTSAMRQPLSVAIERAVTQTFGDDREIPRWEARSALENAIGPVLRHSYQQHVGPTNAQGIPAALSGALLVLGRDSDGYWLLEIDGLNQATFYEEHGFHTVGSGSAAAYVAHALMKGYDIASRDVNTLRLIAYRTVDNCIQSLGGPMMVGGHVQLWWSKDREPFAKCEGEELAAIASGVDQWITIERESLDHVRRLAEEGRREQADAEEEEAESVEMPQPADDDDEGGTRNADPDTSPT